MTIRVEGIIPPLVTPYAKAAEKSGCDAVSIISPFFISPNRQELYEYYKTAAEASNLPVLLYNNPARTGM